MDFIRIGEKIVSKQRIENYVREILKLRQAGYSQNEVAQRLSVDRAFISKLESLGEVRKGKRIAVIGFPVANKEELEKTLAALGVDFVFLLTEKERWQFIREKSGLTLFDTVMEIVAELHAYDNIIFIGSNKRIKIVEAVLDKRVIGFEIGESPLQEDKYVDCREITKLIEAIKD